MYISQSFHACVNVPFFYLPIATWLDFLILFWKLLNFLVWLTDTPYAWFRGEYQTVWPFIKMTIYFSKNYGGRIERIKVIVFMWSPCRFEAQKNLWLTIVWSDEAKLTFLQEIYMKDHMKGWITAWMKKTNDVLNMHDDIFPMIKVSLIFNLAKSYHHY